LPDFTIEWLELENTGPPDLSSIWKIYFNGSKRVEGAGAGVVLRASTIMEKAAFPYAIHVS
jgi:hypothetical protein